MTIYSSAFLGEIWRGCIQAVPRNQWEAAECLGCRACSAWAGDPAAGAAHRHAAHGGLPVQIIKNTSIASLVIGYSELAYNAKILNNSTFQPFIYFGCAAILYFAMCYPLSRWSRYRRGNSMHPVVELKQVHSASAAPMCCAASAFCGRGRGGGPDRQERLGQARRCAAWTGWKPPTKARSTSAATRCTTPPAWTCARCGDVGIVFQSYNLFPHMTVLQNVTLAPRSVKGIKAEAARELAMEALEHVGRPTRPNTIPNSCPAASSSAWPSPARWRCGPRSCCSTK